MTLNPLGALSFWQNARSALAYCIKLRTSTEIMDTMRALDGNCGQKPRCELQIQGTGKANGTNALSASALDCIGQEHFPELDPLWRRPERAVAEAMPHTTGNLTCHHLHCPPAFDLAARHRQDHFAALLELVPAHRVGSQPLFRSMVLKAIVLNRHVRAWPIQVAYAVPPPDHPMRGIIARDPPFSSTTRAFITGAGSPYPPSAHGKHSSRYTIVSIGDADPLTTYLHARRAVLTPGIPSARWT